MNINRKLENKLKMFFTKNWLSGLWTKARTLLAMIATMSSMVFLIVFKAWQSGKQYAEKKNIQRRLNAVNIKKEIDNEVDQLGIHDLDVEYKRWMRRSKNENKR